MNSWCILCALLIALQSYSYIQNNMCWFPVKFPVNRNRVPGNKFSGFLVAGNLSDNTTGHSMI